jgi:hypothetical protein
MLELPKLDSQVVSAGVMGLISAELRLEHAKARHALGETEKLPVPEIMATIIPEILAGWEEGQNGRAIASQGPGLGLHGSAEVGPHGNAS